MMRFGVAGVKPFANYASTGILAEASHLLFTQTLAAARRAFRSVAALRPNRPQERSALAGDSPTSKSVDFGEAPGR
jgi:hypothetical protein